MTCEERWLVAERSSGGCWGTREAPGDCRPTLSTPALGTPYSGRVRLAGRSLSGSLLSSSVSKRVGGSSLSGSVGRSGLTSSVSQSSLSLSLGLGLIQARYRDSEKYQAALMEQYKLYVEMADRISARRGSRTRSSSR